MTTKREAETVKPVQVRAAIADAGQVDEDLLRSVHRSAIEGLKHLAKARRNPIYVWDAVLICLINGIDLPDWCIEYLKGTALAIERLRRRAAPRSDDVKDGSRNLSCYQALTQLPQALQFSRKGWNAFDDFKSC